MSESRFIGGLNDGQIINLFQAARKDDYEKLIEEARSLNDAQDGNQAAQTVSRFPLDLSWRTESHQF